MQKKLTESTIEKARRRSTKGERTRAAILDAAEHAFAQAPYDAVSQRDIAARASVLIGVLTHHYPTKTGLFDAVVGRRAYELNEDRLQRRAALHDPSIEGVLDAFFLPFIERASGDNVGWMAYFQMMQKFVFVGENALIHAKYYKDIILLFTETLIQVLPNVDITKLQLCFSCSIDLILTGVFQPARFEAVFGKKEVSKTRERDLIIERYNSVRPFITGAFKAIA